MSIITVKNLHFKYSSSYTLKDTSLTIKKGVLTGILGPNGSGKSTLLKNILNYLKYDKGVISVNDIDLKKYTFTNLAKIMSFVPQKSNVRSNFLVRDFIILGRMVHLKSKWSGFSSHDKDVVSHIIKRLGLEKFEERSILSLSGGEFQRVLMARALAQEPDILLMDEPTASLDINYAVEIMRLAKELTKTHNLTVIAVLHDLNLASIFCEDLILMKDGQVKFSGKTQEIINTEVLEQVYDFSPKIIEDDSGTKFILPTENNMAVV